MPPFTALCSQQVRNSSSVCQWCCLTGDHACRKHGFAALKGILSTVYISSHSSRWSLWCRVPSTCCWQKSSRRERSKTFPRSRKTVNIACGSKIPHLTTTCLNSMIYREQTKVWIFVGLISFSSWLLKNQTQRLRFGWIVQFLPMSILQLQKIIQTKWKSKDSSSFPRKS